VINIRYIGQANIRKITAADFLSLGISDQGTTIWDRDNNFTVSVSDAAGLWLMAQPTEFLDIPDASYASYTGVTIPTIETAIGATIDKVAIKSYTKLYVDYTNGNDANDGRSEGKAKKFLSSAIAAATPKTCIVLADGFHQVLSEIVMASPDHIIIDAPGHGACLVVNGNFNAIKVTGAAVGCQFRNFKIVSFVQRTAGAGLNLIGTNGGANATPGTPHSDIMIDNVFIQNTYEGIVLDNVHQTTVKDVKVYCTQLNWMTNGIRLLASVSIDVDHPMAVGFVPGYMSGSALILDSDCDTIGVRNAELGGVSGDIFKLSNSLGTSGHTGPRLVRVKGIWTEASPTGNGVAVYSGRDVEISGLCTDQCYNGVWVAGGSSIYFARMWNCLNMRHGVHVSSTGGHDTLDGVHFAPSDVFGNSQETANTYDGYHVDASITSVVEIEGGRSEDHLYATATKQRYGIWIGSGCTRTRARNVDCTNNQTGPALNNSTTGATIKNCKGYNPRGVLGPPTLLSSGTPYTNTYGVDCTVYVNGGTVSAIHVAGSSTGATSGQFRVLAGQTIAIMYTVAPTWTWFGE
jgi:hypothetical protein